MSAGLIESSSGSSSSGNHALSIGNIKLLTRLAEAIRKEEAMHGPTLHAALDEIAAQRPEVAIAFPAEPSELTLAALRADSRQVAAGLRTRGIEPGERVGALCTSEPDFLRLTFALSRLGACLCPMPLPMTSRTSYAARLRAILSDAGVRNVVLSPRVSGMLKSFDEALAGRARIESSDLMSGPAPAVSADEGPVDSGREIVLQYTSGSTASPKGVRLTHANVLACLEAIRDGIDLCANDKYGTWLPLFHDMGLFGTLTAALTGVPSTIWQPSAFVRDPLRWLREFADGGHSVTAMPNFAYDYLVRAVPPGEAEHLDLSRWRVAANGSEPVTVETVESFAVHFASAGFRPQAMMPVYGLAEATLAVTFPPLGRGPVVDWVDRESLAGQGVAIARSRSEVRTRGLVSVGRPVLGVRLRIADPASGALLGERQVGEVQLSGASVATGYVDDVGRLPQPFTGDGWLRTGDLGYLANQELFIVGRDKEVIMLRGVNYYPDDVESAVRFEPGLYRKRCVAFVHVTDDGDLMTLVGETSRPEQEHPDLADRCRALIRAELGLDEVLVILTPPNSIPRTTSGKLQRLAAKSWVATMSS
jgi:fatty-acyl-CoA synthase